MEKLSGKKKKTKRKSLRFKLSDYWGKDFLPVYSIKLERGKNCRISLTGKITF